MPAILAPLRICFLIFALGEDATGAPQAEWCDETWTVESPVELGRLIAATAEGEYVAYRYVEERTLFLRLIPTDDHE